MAQNFEARNSCQPGAALHLLVRPSFRFFRFHFLIYNSPISRFCPSDDASYGESTIQILEMREDPGSVMTGCI